MPAYNEEKRIGKTLDAYSIYFEKLRKKKILDYHILIVINNTKDRTEEIVVSKIKKNKRISFLNLPQKGKGFAVVEGFKQGLSKNYDLIGFVDADMSTSPKEYWKILNSIGKFDGAIADRYIKGAKVYPPATFRRLVVGRIFNNLVRMVFLMNFKDTQCGAKVFSKKSIEKIISKISMSQWAFDVELLYLMKKSGFKIKSIPTEWYDQEYSHINFWSAGPWMALGIIRLRLVNSSFKKFVKFYDQFVRYIPK